MHCVFGRHVTKVVEGVFSKCGLEDIKTFVGVARRIWMRRNEVLHGGIFLTPNAIIKLTQKSMADFRQAFEDGDADHPPAYVQGPSQWVAPDVGWVKANWDAALDSSLGRMGFGVVVRDHMGYVRAARCMTQLGFLSLAAAEARAVLVAIQLCSEMGFFQVQLEGDAKGVVEAVRDTSTNYSRMGPVVDDVKAAVQVFSQWQIGFVKRDNNRAAHALAKLAVKDVLEKTWIDNAPDCIRDFIQLEHFALVD